VWQNCTRCREICPHLHLMGLHPARLSVGQVSESTAKRGMDQAVAPDAQSGLPSGPRCGGGHSLLRRLQCGRSHSIYCGLLGDVRAGRAAARSFVPDSRRWAIVPKGPLTPSLPGTDGKLSCGTGVAKWTGMPVASPCRRKKTATRAKLAWPLDRHRKRCLGGAGVAKWTGMPVASPCRRKKTATRAKLAWPLDRHRKRCLRGAGVAKWTATLVASLYRHSCRSLPSMPPATVTTWPVTCPDTSSDARTMTCRATSSG
jgi:hypothetical protein